MKQLITYETAKLAKELGFKEPCLHYFSLDGQEKRFEEDGYWYFSIGANGRLILRPTQSELQTWLRDEYNMHIEIIHNHGVFLFSLFEIDHYIDVETCFKEYKTYEEALEVGLQEALKIVL